MRQRVIDMLQTLQTCNYNAITDANLINIVRNIVRTILEDDELKGVLVGSSGFFNNAAHYYQGNNNTLTANYRAGIIKTLRNAYLPNLLHFATKKGYV